MTAINQKDYLKKYLAIGKAPGEKRKKKKKNPVGNRVTIIDDDADANFPNSVPVEDILLANEDAPQIVAIIDERPPSLRFDEKTKNPLWQPIGSVGDVEVKQEKQMITGFKIVAKQNEKPVISEDHSPPRRRKNVDHYDNSPLRRKNNDAGDSSPIRTKNKDADDNSPPRRRDAENDHSPPRKKHREQEKPKRDLSPQRSENKSRKMEKTLDGKTAGLQKARQLVEETKQIRKNEDSLFKNLSQEVSGENAQTILRDRKTGKKRDLQEEEKHQQEKNEQEEKKKEKYSRWGRGLVQVESRDQQIQDEVYEMSKPLARYADDEDLEKYLKEQDREGDPMLAYIKKKRRKDAAKDGKVEKPQFEGEFMPNRFGIRPGHRWDGVDRSNGYEKKWFEVQNAKRAQQEDSYKWSTEDM